jgi:hypothetical protein
MADLAPHTTHADGSPCMTSTGQPKRTEAERGPASGKAEAGGMGSWASGKTGPCPNIVYAPKSDVLHSAFCPCGDCAYALRQSLVGGVL